MSTLFATAVTHEFDFAVGRGREMGSERPVFLSQLTDFPINTSIILRSRTRSGRQSAKSITHSSTSLWTFGRSSN